MRACVLTFIILFAAASYAEQPKPVPQHAQKINERCAAKWGDNYRMQKYCRGLEHKAVRSIEAYIAKHGVKVDTKTPQTKIVRSCLAKWTDQYGQYWRMVDYCIKKQDDAYRSL